MISFTVFGTPAPQGSTRAFIPKGWNRAVITTDNKKLKPWRQEVSATALALHPKVHDGAIVLCLDFFFTRPRSAPKSRTMPTVKPDVDKLARGILDALTGILYTNDSQVVRVTAEKHYGNPERCEIQFEEL